MKDKCLIVVIGWILYWMFIKFDLKFLDDFKNVYGNVENIYIIVCKGLKEDKFFVY